MTPRSFFCKSFGILCLLLALLPIAAFCSSRDDWDGFSYVLTGLGLIIFIGGGITLLVLSVDRPAERKTVRRRATAAPVAPAPSVATSNTSKTGIIAMASIVVAALLGLGVSSVSSGDTDADRHGIQTLWWIVERFGIVLLIYAIVFAIGAIGRRRGARKKASPGDHQTNPVNLVNPVNPPQKFR